jgi:homocysteine S-methyltransferase
MFDIVQSARNSGVWSLIIAGGCCKTTPDDIRKLRQIVDETTT